jgi:hypothetical protein
MTSIEYVWSPWGAVAAGAIAVLIIVAANALGRRKK